MSFKGMGSREQKIFLQSLEEGKKEVGVASALHSFYPDCNASSGRANIE